MKVPRSKPVSEVVRAAGVKHVNAVVGLDDHRKLAVIAAINDNALADWCSEILRRYAHSEWDKLTKNGFKA